MLGGSQMVFSLRAMSIHVVMIGGASAIHLMDGFDYVLVDAVEIVPIPHLRGHSCTGNKRQGDSRNGQQSLHKVFSLRRRIYPDARSGTHCTSHY